MYIYHALINALIAHMIHINLNMIFYTHVEHSPTKTIHIKYYMRKKHTTIYLCRMMVHACRPHLFVNRDGHGEVESFEGLLHVGVADPMHCSVHCSKTASGIGFSVKNNNNKILNNNTK